MPCCGMCCSLRSKTISIHTSVTAQYVCPRLRHLKMCFTGPFTHTGHACAGSRSATWSLLLSCRKVAEAYFHGQTTRRVSNALHSPLAVESGLMRTNQQVHVGDRFQTSQFRPVQTKMRPKVKKLSQSFSKVLCLRHFKLWSSPPVFHFRSSLKGLLALEIFDLPGSTLVRGNSKYCRRILSQGVNLCLENAS